MNYDSYLCTPYDNLNSQEVKFIKLCVSEMSYKEISDEMHLSKRSVECYVNRIARKINVKSRSGIIIYAIKNGLVKL